MKKKIKVWEIEDNLRDARIANIENHVNWVIGFPTETPADWCHSLHVLYNTRNWVTVISPGMTCGDAPLSDMNKNWKDYNIAWKENPWDNKFEQLAELSLDSNVYYHRYDSMKPRHCYKIKAVQNPDSKIVSYSNVACDEIEAKVNIPNSFTPNGDGLNDYFLVKTHGCTIIKMQIFNRWGEKLFETDQPDIGWNGTFKNKLCPLGLYYYQVFVKIDRKRKLFNGTVLLYK